jgi:hypothetical protein
MSSLVDESLEAQAFLSSSLKDASKYRLFPEEAFSSIEAAVLASSEVDLQGECMTMEGLNALADTINRDGLWIGVGHDPRNHPVGRAFRAGVFLAPQRNIYFVAALVGTYDCARLPKLSEATQRGRPRAGESVIERIPTDVEGGISFNPHEIPEKFVDDLLSSAPPSVGRVPTEEARKAAVPLAILKVTVTVAVLLGPFLKKFEERLGEHAAGECIKIMSWIKNTVIRRLAELNREVLLVLPSPYKGCDIELVIGSQSRDVRLDAANLAGSACQEAIKVIDALEDLCPIRVVFEYDSVRRQWLPLYAVTRQRGVLTDQPKLVAISQFGGLSSGGTKPVQ